MGNEGEVTQLGSGMHLSIWVLVYPLANAVLFSKLALLSFMQANRAIVNSGINVRCKRYLCNFIIISSFCGVKVGSSVDFTREPFLTIATRRGNSITGHYSVLQGVPIGSIRSDVHGDSMSYLTVRLTYLTVIRGVHISILRIVLYLNADKMMNRKLRVTITEGTQADEKLLHSMWQLRRNLLDLHQSEEDDLHYFHDFCTRNHTYLFTFQDADDTLQGFFTFTFKTFDNVESKSLFILSKYYYVNPMYRGHSSITSAAFRILPKAIRRYGMRSMYITAFVFPSSYVSLSRTFGGLKTIQADNITNREQSMLENFAEEIYGENWDNTEKLVKNQNAPYEENKGKTRSIQALRQEYENINPNWRNGISVPILVKFNLHTIHNILSTNIRRMSRKNNTVTT